MLFNHFVITCALKIKYTKSDRQKLAKLSTTVLPLLAIELSASMLMEICVYVKLKIIKILPFLVVSTPSMVEWNRLKRKEYLIFKFN